MKDSLRWINSKRNYIISLFLLVFAVLVFVGDCINKVNYQVIGFDESYNATVAANVMRYGEYRVSYPDNITFYNMITTGELVILPTAAVYRLFGVSAITTAIVPIVYGALSIIATALFLSKCIKNHEKGYNFLLASILTILVVLADGFFGYISTCLMGEIATYFYLVLSFTNVYNYMEKKKQTYLFFAGAMLAFAFLTKSSSIFFVVTCFGILLIESFVCRSLELKSIIVCLCGFFIGFLFVDSYKLIELGNFEQYFLWWKSEWANMLSQSSGVDISYSIDEKITFLESIFIGFNRYFCILIILFPVALYAVYVFFRLFKKKVITNGTHTMTICGVSAASLLVYFILLGGNGLMYARRHSVNELFIRVFVAYVIGELTIYLIDVIKSKNHKYMGCLIVTIMVLLVGSFPFESIRSNLNMYLQKEKEYSLDAQLMYEFLNEVESLPESANIYAAGWWQEPNITLFLDREVQSIYDVIHMGEPLADENYFIVGKLISDTSKRELERLLDKKLVRVDTSEVEYEEYSTGFDRQDFDLFAIYKIVACDGLNYILGTDLLFSIEDNWSSSFIKYGMSYPENGFTWTDGKSVELCLGVLETEKNLRFEMEILGVMDNNQKVEVLVNDQTCYSQSLCGADRIEFEFENPKNGQIEITINLPNAKSPKELGYSEDGRLLGLMIKSIKISEK